ncbi:MAG: hypothetical protein HOB45_03360 [Planctomycetaceae bacterium]|nr:hypothetical protein [Planctomycetaceae bacterium]
MPLFRSRKKHSPHRRRPNLSYHHSGSIRSPEKLEMRKMLTGNNPESVDVSAFDVEAVIPDLTHEIVSGLETFSSVDAYADWLVNQAVQQRQHMFGQPAYRDLWVDTHVIDEGLAFVSSMDIAPRVNSTGHTQESSTTNTQIAGVDEADFVEVDEDTLYALADGELSVIRDFSEASPELVGQITVEALGQTAGMYLFSDRLTIISHHHSDSLNSRSFHDRSVGTLSAFGRTQTTVVMLDVSNPAALSVVKRFTIDGELESSRMVNGQLRLVLSNRFASPFPDIIPNNPISDVVNGPVSPFGNQSRSMLVGPASRRQWLPSSNSSKVLGTYETAESYSLRVRRAVLESMSPQVYSVDANDNPLDVTALCHPTAIDVPQVGRYQQLTTITAIDVIGEQHQPMVTTGFFTKGSLEVFATTEDIYVFEQNATPSWSGVGILPWVQQSTNVTKVAFNSVESGSPRVSLVAQGTFRGTVLNQFAADEQAGFLRVVVETWDEGSGVVVLEQQGESLSEVGALRGLASNENLYSVRFVGNRAYFVTFRQTDPLFVVDLSSPTDPVLLGELHVPGFSDFIQPIDEDYLLTIGSDADEMTGRMHGLQISIFDVSDSTNPLLVHKHSLTKDSSSSTEITGNRWHRGDGDHLALGFFPDQGVITVPVQTRARDNWGGPIDFPVGIPEPIFNQVPQFSLRDTRGAGQRPPVQYLEVLSFDVESGINGIGVIDHASRIHRAVQIKGFLVGVSEGEVSVHSFSDPNTTLGSVPLDEIRIDHPIESLPDRQSPVFPAIPKLIEKASAGVPLHGSWLVKESEVIGDQQVLYAEHASGAVHRMVSTKPVNETNWASFGFESIRNLESQVLDRVARGSQHETTVSAKHVRSMVSDSVLNQFNLTRNSSGDVQRQLIFATLGVLPDHVS